jgi:Fuc2NAc and GlcNAc transferase
MKIFVVSVVSFLLGWISALLVARFGLRWGLSDVPNERSSHVLPIPKGGGIGIPLAVAVAAFSVAHTTYAWAVGAGLLLSILALVNDKKDLPIKLRLAVEFSLSIAVFRSSKATAASLFLVIFFALYLSASANFFNFMDGINGLAGFEAVISFMLLGIYAYYFRGIPEVLRIALALSFATAGFLLLNFPRARVFMGDTGSLFLGFMFGAFVMALSSSAGEFLLMASFQSLFMIDCASTIFLRALKRENLLHAHKQHLYQKMVHDRGWTHPKVTLIYGTTQATLGILSLLVLRTSLLMMAMYWILLVIGYWAILARLNYVNILKAHK